MKRNWTAALAALALGGLASCADVGKDAEEAQPNPKHLVAEIRHTSYGVPHVKANDYASLGFGVSQAYLRQNFCVLADHVVTVNGERSLHFGPAGIALPGLTPISNRESDFFFKVYFDAAQLLSDFERNPLDVRELIRGYVAGYNDYLAKTGAANLPDACRNQPWVRPITLRDMVLMMAEKTTIASGAAFARQMFNAQPPTGAAAFAAAPRRLRKLDYDTVLAQLEPARTRPAASNGYAIGRDATTNGAGMLLANPHFPWSGSTRFFEIHMTIPGKLDAYGGMWGDAPLPLIGFNADVAWMHTFSPTRRSTLMELTLVPGNPTRYVFDGAERDMQARQASIQVKDASGGVTTETRTYHYSHLGPIVVLGGGPGSVALPWSGTTAYALADVNLANTRILAQWYRTVRSTSVADLKQGLDEVLGIPWVHTTAADRAGNVLYGDIGSVPNVTAAMLQPVSAGGCLKGLTAQAIVRITGTPILDGSRGACAWSTQTQAGALQQGGMPAAGMPSIMRTDYLANSNQSAWHPHPQAKLENQSPIFGSIRTDIGLRPRLAFMQIEQRMAGTDGLSATPKFDSVDTMRKVLYQNRLLAAELALDPLLAACAELPPPGNVTVSGTAVSIAPACATLAGWDRRANLDSRGIVLFREFWRTARSIPNIWAVPFDVNDAVHTPRNLNVADPAVKAKLLETLGAAVVKLQGLNIDYTKPLSELQSVTLAGKRIPMPGGDEFEGTFNKITMLPPVANAGYVTVTDGSSYIQAVTWVNGQVQAEGVQAYSQSVDPKSPHAFDQTEQLYTQGKFKKLRFTDQEIAADPNFRTETVQLTLP
jgi:acyl-homoserine-lactone acylase